LPWFPYPSDAGRRRYRGVRLIPFNGGQHTVSNRTFFEDGSRVGGRIV
jgi:hypothetical protein